MAQGSTTTKVTATDLDIRDLTSVSDSVSAVQSGTWNVTNVSGTVSLPTGASTSTKQDTIITHLDGVEGLLTTIDADTGTIAGAVSGTEMQVDIVGSLPAGSNAIGKLSANSGVDIGDVDVTSVIPGTGATNLGKAIDTATGATDTGVLTLATRDDALSTLTPAEGDNVQLRTDSTGALWVKNSGTVTVDGSAVTQPVSNAGLTELAAAINANKVDVNIVSSDVATGGTSAVDDADFTATSTSGTPAMGVYESTPTNVTDGDMGIVGITTGRRLKTSATIDTALPAGTNAIGKLSANSGVDIGDVDVTSISAGDNTIGRMKLTDGTTVATVRELGTNDALNVAMVDGSGNQITSFGGGTEYTEDVATANPIVGKAIMIERDDALTTVTPVEGDNIGLRGTAEGALWTQDFNSDAILADTTAIKTAVEILDNAIAGSEMQVDIVSSALPTGASTLAEQQSQTTHLATIAGDTTAIETAVQLIDDTVATLGTTTYTETSTKGLTIGAVRRDADTTLVDTTNEIGPLQMNAAGQLKVEVFSGETLPVSMTSTTVTGTVAVTQSGTWDEVGINDSGNSITIDYNGSAISTSNALPIQPPASGYLAVNETGAALTALQLIDDAIVADDAAFTPATTKVMMAGFEADETSADSVDEGDGGAARMTLDRKIITTIQPHTAGGLSVFNASSSDGSTALTNTAQAIKASAGQLYGWYIYNPNSSAQYVQLYNTASASVTVGTTSPLFMLTIPATSAANVEFTNGITFSNAGWSCAATSTAGGNGAPTTALDAVFFYK